MSRHDTVDAKTPLDLEPSELAARLGLSYVVTGSRGYRRQRRGRGFSYHDDAGETLGGRERKRVESLAVPPAWQDVWIASNRQSHILATGVDDAGRKQYIYHPLWEEARDAIKFETLEVFGTELPALRKKVDRHLNDADDRVSAAALAVAILDLSLMRVGNDEYAETNESFGLTTLQDRHVSIRGSRVRFEFVGKGGAARKVILDDDRVASALRLRRSLEGETILSYREGVDRVRSLRSGEINAYLQATIGYPFTAKIFRTWGATAAFVDALGKMNGGPDERDGELRLAVEVAAERLGNSPEICAQAYVHPRVSQAHVEGRLAVEWKKARSGKWLQRSESALRRLLAEATRAGAAPGE